MSTYRILVTGWRDWPRSHALVVENSLDMAMWDALNSGYEQIVVVHGQCPYGGVDLYADQWAERNSNAQPERHPAERGPQGQILGPARNTVMVNRGANRCLAFPGPKSKGTWDCMRKAVDADIPTEVIAWCSAWAKEWAQDADLSVGDAQ